MSQQFYKTSALIAAIFLGLVGLLGMMVLGGVARHQRMPRTLREYVRWIFVYGPTKSQRFVWFAFLWFFTFAAASSLVAIGILRIGGVPPTR